MLTNAERLAILKSIPEDLPAEEREAQFIIALRDRQVDSAKQNPITAQSENLVIERKPCGSCGGGRVR